MSTRVYSMYEVFARTIIGSIFLISAGTVFAYLMSPELFSVSKLPGGASAE
ncbi:MAG: hypothetical protein ACR2OM_12220 [Aestuariivirgaceae bacterium]